LIELIVVVSIIGLLSSIVMTSLSDARERARMAANMQFDANIKHTIGDQMVGEWLFNEGGTTAIDTSSFNNNGTLFGSPVWSEKSGYDGKGVYQFNGLNGIAAPLKGVNTNKITFTAWVKGKNSGSQSLIMFAYGPYVNKTGFWSDGTNQLRAIWSNQSMYADDTKLNMPVDKWTFIAMSVDGSGMTLYMNDKKYEYSKSRGYLYPPINFSLIPLKIGGGYGAGWNGYIDNVRIYTSALTTAQIEALYAEGMKDYPSEDIIAKK
jgi:type II secretory pathway pseudopilin PulG